MYKEIVLRDNNS